MSEDILDDPNRGYYDREGNSISLRKLMEIKGDRVGLQLASDDVGQFRVVSVFLGDAFDDEMLSERPARPRVYGTAVLDTTKKTKNASSLFAEIRSATEAQTLERHKLLVKGLKAGEDAYNAAVKSMEVDQVQ